MRVWCVCVRLDVTHYYCLCLCGGLGEGRGFWAGEGLRVQGPGSSMAAEPLFKAVDASERHIWRFTIG